jgi:hypothetical protein
LSQSSPPAVEAGGGIRSFGLAASGEGPLLLAVSTHRSAASGCGGGSADDENVAPNENVATNLRYSSAYKYFSFLLLQNVFANNLLRIPEDMSAPLQLQHAIVITKPEYSMP